MRPHKVNVGTESYLPLVTNMQLFGQQLDMCENLWNLGGKLKTQKVKMGMAKYYMTKRKMLQEMKVRMFSWSTVCGQKMTYFFHADSRSG